jgi:hypothetical protein
LAELAQASNDALRKKRDDHNEEDSKPAQPAVRMKPGRRGSPANVLLMARAGRIRLAEWPGRFQ